MKIIVNRKHRLADRLIGNSFNHTLEERIFHNVCIVSIAALLFSTGFNYFIGLNSLAYVHACICIFTALIYYYSRYKSKTNVCIILYGCFSNFLFLINFYLNSGIEGPTLLIFLLSIFSIIAVAPKKQYWFWISLNILEICILLNRQYKSPDWIINTYSDKLSRYFDLGVSYVIIVIFIFLVTKYIRDAYNIEKRTAEEKARELEIANDTKNKLFSILAHDLRAPLASIQGYFEMLIDVDLSPDEKTDLQKNLLQKTQHTSEMLSNLLSWTQAQMEGVKARFMQLNLKDALINTLSVQSNIAKQKGIALHHNLDNIWLHADQDMLQLVIRNLVNNAIKFTSNGGSIIVSSQIIKDECVIVVVDNGVGISLARQKDIFSLKSEPTYGTKNEKGVGLGLLLCHEFIQLQNGKIWFESEPGIRTAFYISLKSCSVPAEKEKSDYLSRF